METIKFNPIILKKYFNNKVREMCKSCKRFGYKTTCPPNIETVDYYKNLLPTYKYGIIYYNVFDSSNKEDWIAIGKNSSLEIHSKLLEVRDKLFSKGHCFINIFGAGSCKLCQKCELPCRHPEKSIIPLEATGIDVVKLMKRFKIKVSFPISTELYRIGMVLYE